jgi:hypothetical protein
MYCNDCTTLSLQLSQLATIMTQLSTQSAKTGVAIEALEARLVELEEKIEQRVMTLDATK